MPTKTKSVRVQLTLSDEIVSAMDARCELLGISRSHYISMALVQNLDIQELFLEYVKSELDRRGGINAN